VNKAMHFGDAVAEQAHFGLHPPALWAALAIAVEIGGSLCVVSTDRSLPSLLDPNLSRPRRGPRTGSRRTRP